MSNQIGVPRSPTTLLVVRGDVLSIQVGRGGLRIGCVTGRAWVTGHAGSADGVLLPGDSLRCTRRGRVVIEALRTAAVRLEYVEAAGAATPSAADLTGGQPGLPAAAFQAGQALLPPGPRAATPSSPCA